MDTRMSPEQRHKSRRLLLELFDCSWSCVRTKTTFRSTQKSLNTCKNVSPIVYKTGWRLHSEVQFWLKTNGFATTSGLEEDRSAEWLYEEEHSEGVRGQDLPEWMSESLPDVDPLGSKEVLVPDQEFTEFPEVMPTDKTEIVSVLWPVIQYLLDKSKSKPTKSYDAWLSDCALAVMEAETDRLKDLGSYLREHRRLPVGWKKEFDRLAMKRRVNSWDVGESTGDVKKAIRAQRQETEEYWYKVPSKDQDPSKIAEEKETPPLERKASFLGVMTRLCFLADPQEVSKRMNERSSLSSSGYRRYRYDNLNRLIMLRSLFEWPTATTQERQRFMSQYMRRAGLIKGQEAASKFPLESRSYGRTKSSVVTSITLNTLIWSCGRSRSILRRSV